MVREFRIRELPETNQAEKDAKAALLARAITVGLDDSATEREVQAAENK